MPTHRHSPVGALSRARLPFAFAVAVRRSGILPATAVAFAFVAAGLTLRACAAPTLTESPAQITVANSHFTVTFDPARGGTISELRLPDGSLVCSGHNMYTDWGIFPERSYHGTANCHATVQTRRDGESVTVRAEGKLCDSKGVVSSDPGAIAYWFEVTVGDAPDLRIAWGVMPDFAKLVESAFFAHQFSAHSCIGTFANTESGVLLRDMATQSERTIQSAEDPLDAKAPWLGLMRADGSILAFTDLSGTPSFENVFFHEDGNGNAGVFFAWLCGGAHLAMEPGKEWRGGFTLRVVPSFEEFRARFQ